MINFIDTESSDDSDVDFNVGTITIQRPTSGEVSSSFSDDDDTLDCGVDAIDCAPPTPTFFAPIKGSVVTRFRNRKKFEKTFSGIHAAGTKSHLFFCFMKVILL